VTADIFSEDSSFRDKGRNGIPTFRQDMLPAFVVVKRSKMSGIVKAQDSERTMLLIDNALAADWEIFY